MDWGEKEKECILERLLVFVIPHLLLHGASKTAGISRIRAKNIPGKRSQFAACFEDRERGRGNSREREKAAAAIKARNISRRDYDCQDLNFGAEKKERVEGDREL